MDADEKLLALKKAYADIILNMSKEAAARVMASDRRVARYQHEVKVAKEEGLRMLMRLKQMMDTKTKEMEAASLNQQSKIEELEAQLHEAEDIVRDLREELGEAQDELERVKNVNSQHVNESKSSFSREIPEDNRIHSHQSQDDFSVPSEVATPNPCHQNECRKCYDKIICMCSSRIANRELPSIILRGKELGLYRNGCTQRIQACERNLSDRELSVSGETDKIKDKKNEDEDICKTLTEKISSFQSFIQKRKRASRKRKMAATFIEKQTDSPPKCEYPENQIKDGGTNENLAKSGEETEFSENLGAPGCGMDVEKIGMGSNSLEMPDEPVKERVFKYTFQRKRKRQALGGSEVKESCFETEEKMEDKQNGDEKKVEEPKSSLRIESSRDSRRMAQVARQLLSLSEKKWV